MLISGAAAAVLSIHAVIVHAEAKLTLSLSPLSPPRLPRVI